MPDVSARRRAVVWTAGGLALAVAIAGGVYAAQRASAANALSDHYRVAVASMGDVTASVSLTGSVARVGQESVGFPASGLIDAVKVSVGQHVTAGQTLATMDPTSLNLAVLDAKAQLAQAQAAVVTDESAGSGTGSASGSSSSRSSSSGSRAAATSAGGSRRTSGSSTHTGAASSTGPSGHTGVSASTLSSIKRLSTNVGAQVRSAGTASQAEQRACAPFLAGSPTPAPTATRPPRHHTVSNAALTNSPTRTPAPTDTPTPPPVTSAPPTQTSTPPPVTGTTSPTTSAPPSVTATPPPRTSTSPPVDTPQLAACLAAVRTATTDVNRAMSTLGQLSSLVTSASRQLHAGSTGGTSSSPRSPAGHSTAATGSPATDPPAASSSTAPSAAPPSSTSGGTGRSPSGSNLAADEAAVTEDQLSVTQAEQSAAGTTLVAPISGVVGAVGVTAGRNASPSSTITVVGAGAAQITVQAPLSDLPSLATGQQAQVAAAGGLPALTGRVTQIGILPASSGSSSPTYPVTVVVPDAPPAFATGSSAQITIATHRVTRAVTVPESALVMVGDGRARVQLVSGGTVTDQVVSVGAVGQGRAQITSGLKAGQTVILADLTEPLPANQTAGGFSGRGLVGGGGGRFAGRGATPR